MPDAVYQASAALVARVAALRELRHLPDGVTFCLKYVVLSLQTCFTGLLRYRGDTEHLPIPTSSEREIRAFHR